MYDKSPSKLIEYQRSLLLDEARTHSFERAIQQTVHPGDVVLDLGCGSGVLSFFACRAGARRVYAIEVEATIAIAKILARQNGFANRVVFLQGLSTQMELPEKADVLVTETIGNFGLEEGILGWVMDARQRLLKEGSRIVPATLTLFIAPLELGTAYQKLGDWGSDQYGLDFSAVRALSANQLVWPYFSPQDLLGEPAELAHIRLSDVRSDQVKAETILTIQRQGILQGLGGWFQASLVPEITISNAPGSATPSWRQAFLPFERPVEVSGGERFKTALHVAENGALWTWQVSRLETGGKAMVQRRQSTFRGQLVSPTRPISPAHRPVLNALGEMTLFTLELIGGGFTMQEIARRLSARFPERFESTENALVYVRSLVARYGKEAAR